MGIDLLALEQGPEEQGRSHVQDGNIHQVEKQGPEFLHGHRMANWGYPRVGNRVSID